MSHYRRQVHLGHISALLNQDQESLMPSKAGPGRAEQLGLLASLSHKASLDPDYVDTLHKLFSIRDTLTPKDARMIDLAYEDLRISQLLSEEFVVHYETLKSNAQQARQQARQENNFSIFQPFLEEMVAMTKQYARTINPDANPYDTLLDIYEEDATQSRYDSILLPLQAPLTRLLTQVAQHDHTTHRECSDFDRGQLDNLLRKICADVGFDRERGAMAEVTHPFMTTLGSDDYRINTRYTHLSECLTSMIHELGHGLYEMYNRADLHYTPLHYGASTGMHESQSRTLENIIARSPEFVAYLQQLASTIITTAEFPSSADLLATITHVQQTFIRTEADEISYNLHILLRYQIEKELFSDQLSVSDLPARRNTLMQQYLGITPQNDSLGCLQDVHRSCGLFGYFPTYMLGNLYAGQIRHTFQQQHPDAMTQIAQGDFSAYHHRYRDHIRQYGRLLKPRDLLRQATGKDLDSQYFMDYLEKKYRGS